MGRKQQTTKDEEEEPKEVKNEEKEDSPIVKTLKEIDDRYLKLEKEYLQEVYKLRNSYDDKLKANHEERKAKLRGENGDGEATKALPKFWLTALGHHELWEQVVLEHDADVLEHLDDVTTEYLDSTNHRKGLRVHFHFAKNKWFDHEKLSLEIKTDDEDPKSMWQNEPAPPLEIKCIPENIEWKAGQDVTVEKVAKKVKGGGAKKAKQKKEKEEPRPSFFRLFFRTFKKDDELPDDLQMMMKMLNDDMDMDEEDEDDMEADMEDYLGLIGEMASELDDNIIPHAVRWYTGEASPDDDDDFDEDGEEEDDDDDEESDDDDSPASRGKKGGGKGKAAKKKPGKSPKDSPATGPAADPKKEECKQQ